MLAKLLINQVSEYITEKRVKKSQKKTISKPTNSHNQNGTNNILKISVKIAIV